MHVSSLISRILVSSSEILIENLKGSKSEALQLKKNDNVEAKVAKVLPNGTAKLSIAGQTVVAKTHVLLTEGETINLKVISDGDSKVLKLAAKNSENFVPEGLKEMRAMGRSGLYSKLTKVLNEYLPSPEKQTSKKLHNHDLQTVLKKSNPIVETKNPITNKTNVAIEVKPFNVIKLRTLIDNKNISWPEKAASVIIQSELKNNVIPPKMIERFVEKLVLPFSKESATETQKPLLTQLGDISKKMEARLSVKDTILINNVVKDERVPWEYKFLALLSSDKNTVSVKESAPIQKILIKSLTQSGYVIPDNLLSENFVEVNSDYSKSKSLHVIKKIENLLGLLSLNPDREPDVESLKLLVKNSGLMWEKKLSSVFESLKEPITLRDAENLINNDIKALAMKLDFKVVC